MNRNGKTTDIIADIAVMYELSLSIGNSIDINENCQIFISKLLSKKNYKSASVWLKNNKNISNYELVYNLPNRFQEGKTITLNQEINNKLVNNGVIYLSADTSLYTKLSENKSESSEQIYIFNLDSIGILILQPNSNNDLSYAEISQLESLLSKFAISLKGCLSNSMLLDELSQKEEHIKKLHKAQKESEKSLKLKQKFIDHFSHEIKTPMNAIMGFCHLLFDTNLNKDQKKQLEIIYNSSENLLGIVNDIVDYSRITEGNIELNAQEFSIKKLISQIYDTLNIATQEKNIKINISIKDDTPPVIICDKNRLNQILMNLISNAVQYTNNGFVNITTYVELKKHNKAVLNITVSDTGLGISEEKLKNIFLGYENSSEDSQYSKTKTGLGLPIVKGLVEAMDGTVTVKSKVNEGSTFHIKLPVDLPIDLSIDSACLINNEPEKDEFEKPVEKFLKILIVEDNTMNQLFTKKLLQKQNLISDIAVNGKDAVDKSSSKKYDIILMDISMPVMDGFEATKLIRSDNNLNSKTPIIAITADAYTSIREQLNTVGIDDYLAKPLHPRKLLSKISKWRSGKAV